MSSIGVMSRGYLSRGGSRGGQEFGIVGVGVGVVVFVTHFGNLLEVEVLESTMEKDGSGCPAAGCPVDLCPAGGCLLDGTGRVVVVGENFLSSLSLVGCFCWQQCCYNHEGYRMLFGKRPAEGPPEEGSTARLPAKCHSVYGLPAMGRPEEGVLYIFLQMKNS